MEAGYNKDEELEADREGMRLAVLSGYSPYGAVTLFEKICQATHEYIIHAQSPEQELSEWQFKVSKGTSVPTLSRPSVSPKPID